MRVPIFSLGEMGTRIMRCIPVMHMRLLCVCAEFALCLRLHTARYESHGDDAAGHAGRCGFRLNRMPEIKRRNQLSESGES